MLPTSKIINQQELERDIWQTCILLKHVTERQNSPFRSGLLVKKLSVRPSHFVEEFLTNTYSRNSQKILQRNMFASIFSKQNRERLPYLPKDFGLVTSISSCEQDLSMYFSYKKPVYKKPRARNVKMLRNLRAGILAT